MAPSTPYNSPPPPSALPLLARAHILLHTHADALTETEFGAIAACGIMIYGVVLWRVAERRCRAEIVDEEEGMILLEFEDGDGEIDARGKIREREVEFVGEDGDEKGGFDGEKAGEEVRELVRRAVGEIKAWDQEVGKRVEFVMREVVWEKLEK